MKKILLLLSSMILLISMTACGGNASTEPEGSSSEEAPVPSVGEPASQAEEPISAETPDESENIPQPPSSAEETVPDEAPKALVVYFSATGNTKAVAETLAEMQGADLYEIVPEQPYTDEDLNYNDPSSRASVEHGDETARPAMAGEIDNVGDYDIIYVGFPIWWGNMPRILETFFDTYDLSGKVIAPFCTSGSSGISTAVETIGELEPAATVTQGLRTGSSTMEADLTQWLSAIDLAEQD